MILVLSFLYLGLFDETELVRTFEIRSFGQYFKLIISFYADCLTTNCCNV